MADDQQSAPDITITVKGPSELKLSITISPSKSVVDLKEAIAKESDVEKDRQRLIYSGKVLKDEDSISQYKIQNGHTMHMVKGAVKPASQPSTSTAGAAAAPRLPQMGTGINPAANPLEGIENMHHGLAGFNPFTQMQGLGNLNDPNAMAEMMNSDAFLQQMGDMMGRPEMIEQMIASNPQLAPMRDQIRATMSNPMFRQMMSNPQMLRMIMQMQAQNGGAGGGFGGMGGMGGMPFPGMPTGETGGANTAPNEPFPNLFAPQAPSATPPAGAGAGTTAAAAGGAGGAGAVAGQGAAANPFAAMFGPGGFGGMGGMGGFGAGAGAGTGATGDGGNQNAANPWMFNPSMFGGGFPAAPAAPRDTRPPEEIYATQLGQLNDMGLWDAQKNIRALRSTGGNVQAAIELIFSGQLDAPGGQ